MSVIDTDICINRTSLLSVSDRRLYDYVCDIRLCMLCSFRAVIILIYLDKLCYLKDTNLTKTTEKRGNKEYDKNKRFLV
jgi:hypothetical protein